MGEATNLMLQLLFERAEQEAHRLREAMSDVAPIIDGPIAQRAREAVNGRLNVREETIGYVVCTHLQSTGPAPAFMWADTGAVILCDQCHMDGLEARKVAGENAHNVKCYGCDGTGDHCDIALIDAGYVTIQAYVCRDCSTAEMMHEMADVIGVPFERLSKMHAAVTQILDGLDAKVVKRRGTTTRKATSPKSYGNCKTP